MGQGRRKPRAPAVPRAEPVARRRGMAQPPARTVRSASPSPVERRPPGRRHYGSPRLIFGGVAALLVAVVGVGGWPFRFDPLPTYLVAINAATFLLYAYDKAVAGRGRLRIPESVLHGLALLGGTLAALLGQRLFRHKVSKAAFQRVFVTTAIVQVALVGAFIWWRRR
jgi:uncharacterized membrane protein YsdA (DUF1294 family)